MFILDELNIFLHYYANGLYQLHNMVINLINNLVIKKLFFMLMTSDLMHYNF